MAESPTMEVRARLSADSAQFTQGMDRAVKSANEFQQASSKLQGALTGIGIASGAAIAGLIAFGVKSFKAAAEVERLDLALEAVGASSGKGYEALKSTSDGMRALGINAAAAQKTTLKFAQSNIDLSQATLLAKTAQDLSVASSTTAEEALQSITMAVTTGNTRVLRQIGITTGASDAYQRYAVSIGKASKDLTMNERRQAVVNLVMKEGTKAAGAYALAMESPAKLITMFADLHDDLQVTMGAVLVKGFGPIIKSAFKFEKTIIGSIESGGKLSVILEAIQKVFVKLTAPIAAAIDKFSEFIAGMDMTGTKVNDLAGKFEMILPVIAGFGTAFATMAGTRVFAAVPIFGSLLKMLNPVAVGFLAMALTSSQVQTAMGRLLSSLRPLLDVSKKIGDVFTKVLAVAVMVFAKAINEVASVVERTTKFFKDHEKITKVLAYIFGGLAAAVVLSTIAFVANVAITKIATGVRAVMGVVTALLTRKQLATIASTNALAASMLRLNAIMLANPFIKVIIIIAALVTAFVYAWKNSETFREVVTDAFNQVATAVGTALSFILTGLGNLLNAFGTAIAPTTAFGQTLIQVFQFIYTTTLTVVVGVVKALMMFLEALKYVTSGQTAFGQVVRAVLNFIFKTFAMVIGGILKFIGFFLEGLGNLIDTHGIVGKIIAGVLNFIFKVFATVVGGIIKFIGMFIEFLGSLLDTHNIIGKAIVNVLEFLIDAFATIFGNIFKYIGIFISFLGDLLSTNSFVGEGIAKIINFIADVYFTLVSKVSGFLARIIGALAEWIKGNRRALEIAIDLFNTFAQGVGKALALIPNSLATILEKIGSFVQSASAKIGNFFKDAADAARSSFFTRAAAGALDSLSEKFTKIGENVGDTFKDLAKPIRSFATNITDATKTIIEDKALDELIAKLATSKKSLETISKTASGLSEKKFGDDVVKFISNGISKIGSVSTIIGATLLESTKVPLAEAFVQTISDALTKVGGFAKLAGDSILEAGDIELGTELVQLLSDASQTIGGATSKIGDFVYGLKQFEVGDILGDFVGDIVDFAIPQIEKLVNVMEGLKDVEVGKFLVENLSAMTLAAGEKVLGFAEAVKSFTTGDVLGKVTGAFGDLADKLKEGLGFGDILEEERKRAEALEGINGEDDATLDELQKSADLMKKIRDAMTAGIESMRDVLTDLQDAAKQFADSLKDTILSFAGLKGVELPDGFIPKAKSLIENMRMRLDKSQQFANQILTLQGLGLDANAIKDLVESGPIKGAQLAASILGGGVDAITQINDLQKAIGFTGAAIGKFGSDAAFGQKIANAQLGITQVTDAQSRISGVSGNNIVIEQGAFVVNVDTTGAKDIDEKGDIITRRIQETFAILAKELANK
jgi:phage-related protein